LSGQARSNRMTKPNTIEQLNSIRQFNEERGQATYHEHVSVLNQAYSTPFIPHEYLSGLYLIFLKESECEGIQYGRGRYDFCRDSLLFIAPGQVFSQHQTELYRPKGWVIAIHPDFVAGQALHLDKNRLFHYESNAAVPVTAEVREQLIRLFSMLQTEVSTAPEGEYSNPRLTQNVIANYIRLILSQCNRAASRLEDSVNKPPTELLVRFENELQQYVEQGKTESVGLPTVKYFASRLHLSPNYFGDAIKSETGMSAKAFIEKWLTSIAKQKMANPSLSIAQVAYQLGFSHPQHFTRFFKRNVGMSPTQYR